MLLPVYTKDFRKNLTLFWRQFYPNWEIPIGFHVHHIKPKCTFEDKNDLRIHHPRNLIALHPDDHVAIHRNRGDKYIREKFLLSVVGAKMPCTEERKRKLSVTTKGRVGKPCSEITKQKIREARAKQIMKPMSEETKRKIGLANSGTNGRTFLHTKATKLKMQQLNKTRIPVLINGINYASAAERLGYWGLHTQKLNG